MTIENKNTNTVDSPCFTGGNWVVNELSMHEDAFEILTDSPMGQNMNGYIAYIKCSNYTVPNQAKANAHLIAASKDMYAALQDLLSTPFSDIESGAESFIQKISNAKKAFNKAQGK